MRRLSAVSTSMLRVRINPSRFDPSAPLRPPRRYLVFADQVRFQYGIHNTLHQRRLFGTHANMPDLVIERSEIPGAGLGLKVMQDTDPGTFAAIYGEEISTRRARYLSEKVARIKFGLFCTYS